MPGTVSDAGSDRSRCRAARLLLLAYLAIPTALLHRLFLGEVLHPGANIHATVPFKSQWQPDYRPYLNGIQGDVWRHVALFERGQYLAARQRRFPTWNPHIYCGFPFHADGQSGMLSPFHWAYFLVDPNWARGPLAILRMWIGAAAVFALCRRHGLGQAAAFVSGLVWMLGSFNIRWLLWNLSTVTLWLPVLLLALEWLTARPGCLSLAAAGAAAAVLQLSGHPETQFQASLVAGLYVVVRVLGLGANVAAKLRRLACGLAAMVLGLAGAAAALWPFTIQMLGSADWQQRLHTSMPLPWRALVLFLSPDHFGRPRAGYLYQGPVNYNEAACWFGLLPLALALAAASGCLLRVRRRLGRCSGRPAANHGERQTLGGKRESGPPAAEDAARLTSSRPPVLAIFALLLLMCSVVMVFDVPGFSGTLRRLPLVSQCNNLRMLFGVQLAGALLAGLGFELLVAGSRLVRLLVTAFLGLFFALLLMMFVTEHWCSFQRLLVGPGGALFWQHAATRCLGGLVTAAVCLLAVMALLAGRRRRRPVGPLGRGVLAAAIAFDLLWVAWDYNPTCPVRVSDPPAPPLLQWVRGQAGAGRVVATGEVLVPNLAMRYGLRDVRGYDYPIAERLATLLSRLRLPLTMTLIPAERVFPRMDAELAAFLDRAGVRYLYSDRRQSAIEVSPDRAGRRRPPWPLAGPSRGSDAIYVNRNAYPRAWMARSYAVVSRAAALETLVDPAANLLALSVVELPAGRHGGQDGTFRRPLQQSGQPNSTEAGPCADDYQAVAAGRVSIVRDDPEQVVLQADSPTGGLVVLADRMDRGWRVTVDGRPARPLTANYLFRGVLVPPGRHRVQWQYTCPGLRTGLLVSAVTALLLISLALSRRSFGPKARAG